MAVCCSNHRSNECEAFVVAPSRTETYGDIFQNGYNDNRSRPPSRAKTSAIHPRDRFHSRYQATPISSSDNNDAEPAFKYDNSSIDSNSTVYQDLENLERAIALEQKESKLEHSILKEKIEFIDQSKRLLIPDALRFFIIPLFYSYGLFRLLSTGKKGLLPLVGGSLINAMDLHFWLFVVGAPIFLNSAKTIAKWRQGTSTSDPRPDELNKVDPVLFSQFLKPYYDWEDPNENCDEPVTFLAEYWSSVVNGVAILYACKFVTKQLFGISLLQSNLALLWLSCVQLVTRLAAVASLYQFPEKLYDLERSEFTRPVGFFPLLMQKLVGWMMTFAPLGVICDFSKVLRNMPPAWVLPLYASIAVTLWGTWARMNESISSNNRENPLEPVRLKPAKPLAKLAYALSYFALWRKHLPLKKLKEFVTLPVEALGDTMSPTIPLSLWKAIGLGSIAILPILGPLIHLKAFSKLFVVEYSNDLPLMATKENYEKAIEERPERAYDMAWRHRIRWRKPRRLAISKEWIYHKIVYWYLIEGTVWERERNDRNQQIEFEARQNMPTFEQKYNAEMKNLLEGQLLNEGRDQWKERAHEALAKEHESNYVTKRLEDPLGVAIYKAFGVALGFNFDHMTKLKPGQEPSPRRLQARAAKSAMRRYNELQAAEASLQSEIEALKDSEAKQKQQKRLDALATEIDGEIAYIASKLKVLIPTTCTNDEFAKSDAKKFTMLKPKPEPKYRKVSENEVEKFYDDPIGYDGPLTKNYLT